MIKGSQVQWKIDEAEELLLAIIEDTEDGMGICEFPDWRGDPWLDLANAIAIVDAHNKNI